MQSTLTIISQWKHAHQKRCFYNAKLFASNSTVEHIQQKHVFTTQSSLQIIALWSTHTKTWLISAIHRPVRTPVHKSQCTNMQPKSVSQSTAIKLDCLNGPHFPILTGSGWCKNLAKKPSVCLVVRHPQWMKVFLSNAAIQSTCEHASKVCP